MTLSRAVSPISKDLNLDQDVDGLLSGYAWASDKVSYSFPDNASEDYGKTYNGFLQFNPAQQDAVKAILEGVSDSVSTYTNLGVTLYKNETGPENDADALIRYASAKNVSDAYASYPSEKDTGGDAWFTTSGYYNDPSIGTGAFTGIAHETGHTLGLKHPFENSGFGRVPADHQSLEYTVMSYSSYVGAKGWDAADGNYPQTLMMDDIAALQYMYGANLHTHSENTTYRWSPLDGSLTTFQTGSVPPSTPTFDAPNTRTIFMTIWDGGGTDTYDFSQFTSGLVIDLRPGHWIQTVDHSQTANLAAPGEAPHWAAGIIANAWTVKTPASGNVEQGFIENAIGGHGNDTFIANAVANSFTGGGGSDLFIWKSLADIANTASGAHASGAHDVITDFHNGDEVDLRALHLTDVITDTHVAGVTTISGHSTAGLVSLQVDGIFNHSAGWLLT